MASRLLGASSLLVALLAPVGARAESPPRAPDGLTFHADRLDGDPALREVTLRGHVELAYDRYRLRADRLKLRFEDGAVVFDGEARAALCPCPAPPVTFLASGGRFEPPGDLVLRFPRIALGGVPVFALPWLWLRSPEQIGVLPPIVAVRGADGLLLGSGVHLPWRRASGAVESLDLTAGGYASGGAELGARLVTTGSTASVTADLIHGTRVALDARGAVLADAPRAIGVAWTLDAIRGDRARSGTIDLDPGARPFDTGAAEVSLRAQTGAVSDLVAGGVVARALRGEGAIAVGPRSTLGFGGPLGGIGSWSADALGVVLGDQAHAVSIGRASARAELDARPGPFELRASAGARARFAGVGGDLDANPAAPSTEEAAAVRADLDLPFARAFASAPGEAPLVHWITPGLSIRGALAGQSGAFFQPIGGALPSASWLAATGVGTALGRYAGPALRVDLRAGATGDATGVEGLLHARLGADARVVAASVEAAAVGARVGEGRDAATTDATKDPRGAALVARVRVGDATGPWLRVDATGQTGAGAAHARAIAWNAWASLPGDDLAYLAAAGWTGGAELSIPWGRGVVTGFRTDMDLEAQRLLAIRGNAGYRHPCGCFGVGLLAAHRVGRDGVDVALSIDLAPPVPARPREASR